MFGLFYFCFTCVAHANPIIFTLILDASGSISDQDFRTMNRAVSDCIDNIYQIRQTRPGQPADWVSVAWFGGRDQYRQTPYINGSNKTQLDVLASEMRNMRHPQYGQTAIYSALLKGTLVAAERDSTLPGRYNHVITLVTDGVDGNSPEEVVQAIRRVYPNNAIILPINDPESPNDAQDAGLTRFVCPRTILHDYHGNTAMQKVSIIGGEMGNSFHECYRGKLERITEMDG